VLVVAAALFLAAGVSWAAQPAGALFPQPFVVEHHVVQAEAGGATFVGEAVTDHYGGSVIVSRRPDGSRVIVDLARREITELRPDSGSYSVLGFDQMAELTLRLQRAELPEPEKAEGEQAAAPAEPPAFTFAELPLRDGLVAQEKSAGERDLLELPGVRHLRVGLQPTPGSESAATVDVWLHPQVRLTPAAVDALARFEREVLGAGGAKAEVPFSAYVDAARRQDRAFPLRTLRPLSAKSETAGTFEDVVTRLEPLAAIPDELLQIPEGYRRVAHPLELMVSWAEDEKALREGHPR
jgi:hypothetical protein